jgi:hypothetical protein
MHIYSDSITHYLRLLDMLDIRGNEEPNFIKNFLMDRSVGARSGHEEPNFIKNFSLEQVIMSPVRLFS